MRANFHSWDGMTTLKLLLELDLTAVVRGCCCLTYSGRTFRCEQLLLIRELSIWVLLLVVFVVVSPRKVAIT